MRVGQAQPPRKAGALKGLFEVTDEFFEPLPDDILDAFCSGSIEPKEDDVPEQEPSIDR